MTSLNGVVTNSLPLRHAAQLHHDLVDCIKGDRFILELTCVSFFIVTTEHSCKSDSRFKKV